MNALELIYKKRSGAALTREEIEFLIRDYVAEKIPDYQMSAFLMAVYFRGMTEEETFHFTMAMTNSGEKVKFTGVSGFLADKHSTGGVGDKVTLVLVPLCAAAGLKMGKLSGRGLGHTGGTIDKLESIPGFHTDLSISQFSQLVQRNGLALAESTGALAPADHLLYALRDVTATVECLPLIVGSILSKKLAIQSHGIVFDVKTGSGAIMQKLSDSRKLAKALVKIAKRSGRKASALITDMSQPLGNMVGNALEMREALETLQGKGPADLKEVCLRFGIELLLMSKLAKSPAQARKKLESCLNSGEALEKLAVLLHSQGAEPQLISNLNLLPIAAEKLAVVSKKIGFVKSIHARAIGEAAHQLGAGRTKKDDKIDYAVGIELVKKVGDRVERGESLAILHVNDRSKLDPAMKKTLSAFELVPRRPKIPKLVIERIS